VRGKLLVVLLAAAAAAAAILANVLLLGSAAASNDPVGRLSPSAHLAPAPPGTIRPTTGLPQEKHADD
jgi:hypothetical protein